MRKFMVTICGENFHLEAEGAVKRLGFYTTRYVEARDEEEAEQRAFQSVQQHEWLGSALRNDQNDPPKLYADDIEEFESFDGVEDLSPGFSFFSDNTTVN